MAYSVQREWEECITILQVMNDGYAAYKLNWIASISGKNASPDTFHVKVLD